VEVLTPAFGQKFWEFVQAGRYQQKEGDPVDILPSLKGEDSYSAAAARAA
jgi:hypothetical protein